MITDADIIVVGGGPAGCAAAIRLAEAGRQVLLLEKSREPHHKVCGEFLSAEAVDYLARLSVDVSQAVPVTHMSLACGKTVAGMPLPFTALSLSRKQLDAALLARAEQAGVTVWRGATVVGWNQNSLPAAEKAPGCRVSVCLSDGQQVCGHTLMLAHGKTEVPGQLHRVGKHNGFIGFKQYYSGIDHDPQVSVFLFSDSGGSYGGLQPVENGQWNLCMAIDQSWFRQQGKQWSTLLPVLTDRQPKLAEALTGMSPCWPKPLSISRVPYGFVYQPQHSETYYRLGDQLAVIPSFCGEGLSIALHTGVAAAQNVLKGHEAGQFYKTVLPPIRSQVKLACTLFEGYRRLTEPSIEAFITAGRYFPAGVHALIRMTRLRDTVNWR